jgi:hypothetical protein
MTAEPYKDTLLPITFTNYDPVSDHAIQLYNATFLEDWGPFKKGEVVECLVNDFEDGWVASYDQGGKELVRVNVKLMPAG